MIKRLRWLHLVFLLFVCNSALQAQNTITTLALNVSSVCPGSTIDVPFTRTGEFNLNSYSVQLSDGSDYKTLSTGTAVYNSRVNVYTIQTAIPTNQAAGTTYSIRVIASSPAVIGTPSATKLTINTKPAPPLAPSEVTDCQKATGSNNIETFISVTAVSPNTATKLYFTNGDLYLTSTGNRGFVVAKNSATYYTTQTVDGCESDKRTVKVTIKPKADITVTPLNIYGRGDQEGPYGKIEYCLGDKAVSLKEYGILPIPDNITVSYRKESGDLVFDNNPPVPRTDKPGKAVYSFITYLDGCASTLNPYGRLTVTVNPPPGKPVVSAKKIMLCQAQVSNVLSATVTDISASLIWYGSDATGGTGSTIATRPSTANIGTSKYYVAQKLNGCESERAEITVETIAKPTTPLGDPIQYDCQYRPGSANANTYTPYSTIYLSGLIAGSDVNFYDATGAKVNFIFDGYSDINGPYKGFRSPAYVNASPKVVDYYATQTVNGCESDKKHIQLIVKAQIEQGPVVTASESVSTVGSVGVTSVKRVKLCQGSGPITFNDLPIKAEAGYHIGYCEVTVNHNIGGYFGGCDNTTLIAGSTIFETTTLGRRIFRLSSSPDNPSTNCGNNLLGDTYIAVDVIASPGKPSISTNLISYCQSQSSDVLSATTTDASASLVWYGTDATGGIGATTALKPSTSNAGTFKYYVSQKLNGCESERAEITVEIKITPTAPVVKSVSVCQNANAPTLQIAGQNLLWYANSTGGTGSAITPTVNTSQTGSTSYYVTQSINSCESPRAALSVTINAIPGVPIVSTTGPVYCQNAMASALAATGQGLSWYRETSGGTSLGENPVPDTKDVGNFTYYVSQTINGCEGSRSSLTVKVNAIPAVPTVTSALAYCQKTAASALTATGNALKWYDMGGKSSDTPPIPATDVPGTISYFVTQTADNCESARAEIKVTTKPTPAVPGTSAVLLCQNDPAPTLSASGQNLLWYTAESGGTGSGTTPVLTTSQAGSINYYVSQVLDGCEGPRATLAVTVKPLPAVPGVSSKDICQFAKTEPLAATGDGLIWYSPDGSKGPMSPTPSTDNGATYTYLVTQTINGCEGPKASLLVNVLTTPVPAVGKSIVELCQNAIAQPLTATGTNLKWTDPSGVVSTSAPVPPTLNATTKPEGDIYYVTQTGTNGCESPRVAIKVFVQTAPTMTILGTTTTNLGLEVPLKLTFTGVGPYRFKLSNGFSGTALKDTTILVLPERTATYQVVEVANKCGVGQAGNATPVTITVLIPTIQTLALPTTTVCAGTNLSTNFKTSGAFNPGSVFKLQFAKVETDTTKANFMDIPATQATNGQVVGMIPANTPSGTYWIRVLATNPKIPIIGTISSTILTIRSSATATLTGTQAIFEGQPAKLAIAFTGDGPWSFSCRDSSATSTGAVQTVQTDLNPYSLEVRPLKTTSYVLTNVSNSCGTGTRTGSAVVVTVNPLLGIDDQILADAVDVFPVPTTTTLTVHIRGLVSTQPALLELADQTGRTTIRQETRRETTTIILDHQPAGIYILHIRVGDRTASKRIVKL